MGRAARGLRASSGSDLTRIGLVALLLSSSVVAERRGNNYVALDVGAYGSNLTDKYSNATPGAYRSKVGSIAGLARLRRGWHLGKRFFFEPTFGLVIPWRSGVDGTARVFTGQFDLGFEIPLLKFLGFRLGPGIYILATQGTGEEVPLNNGTTVSTFYSADGVSFGFQFSTMTGLAIHFSRRVHLNLDAYVLALGSRERRSYNAAVTLGWVL